MPIQILNIDLSTISAATDVAFGFGEPLQEVVDLNVQSGPDADLAGRLLLYNAAYHHHYAVPVRTVLMLLRPVADHSKLTGRVSYQSGRSRVEFEYEVVRLWQEPPELFLRGGLGLLPLAVLCQLPADIPAEQALREVIHEIDKRLFAEAPHGRAVQLMTAAFILTGMRIGKQLLGDIFQGVKIMHESSAFDVYEDKGRVEGCQRILLRLARNRFGPPDEAVETELRAIHDLDRLARLADAVLTAHSWEDLLGTP